VAVHDFKRIFWISSHFKPGGIKNKYQNILNRCCWIWWHYDIGLF